MINLTKNTTNNAIMSLNLYKEGSTWKFDDETNNIVAEPFVLGMSEMIDYYVNDSKIKNTTIIFSHNKFPKCQELNLIEEESDGGWYLDFNSYMIGWLCPVTKIYMKGIPKTIYFSVQNPSSKKSFFSFLKSLFK